MPKSVNFEELLKIEAEQHGFISRVYNSFNEIREYGRSNRGSQAYKKVTISMCVDYLSGCKFKFSFILVVRVSRYLTKSYHLLVAQRAPKIGGMLFYYLFAPDRFFCC